MEVIVWLIIISGGWTFKTEKIPFKDMTSCEVALNRLKLNDWSNVMAKCVEGGVTITEETKK